MRARFFEFFARLAKVRCAGRGEKNRKEKKGKKERDGGREGQELIKIEL